ncbi:MAG: cytochrome oxidase maturation protein, cbb3-type [Oceanospirillales bacterium LUC14_002_19_P2]|nr:MAG: cytochrome oxidase maturation protein, cbb3-type [Oceanospirillales bacterium LUC14_002_19_P2]
MASLYLLIPLAVIFVIIALALFFWAVDNGQFDDMEGPAHSILFDDKPRKTPTHTDKQDKKE